MSTEHRSNSQFGEEDKVQHYRAGHPPPGQDGIGKDQRGQLEAQDAEQEATSQNRLSGQQLQEGQEEL